MPHPIEVFDNPTAYWQLLTAPNEADWKISTLIERKLARDRVGVCEREQEPRPVGVGISQNGHVKGLSHLTDSQRNSIVRPGDWLLHQGARVKLHDCSDSGGKATNSLNAQQLDQLRRDKKIVSFEDAYCYPYDPRELDQPLLAEFRKVYHSDARYQ